MNMSLNALSTMSSNSQQEPTTMAASPAAQYIDRAERAEWVGRVKQAAVLEQQKKTIEVDPKQAAAALDEINKTLQMATIGVRFELDKDAHTLVTKVVDTQSGDLIRQMPSEEMLQVLKSLGKLQGLLVSQKV